MLLLAVKRANRVSSVFAEEVGFASAGYAPAELARDVACFV